VDRVGLLIEGPCMVRFPVRPDTLGFIAPWLGFDPGIK